MDQTDKKILEILKGTTADSPKPTLQISKIINGTSGTTKQVNPDLYKLQKKGFIDKKSNDDGSRPQWFITTKGQEMLL